MSWQLHCQGMAKIFIWLYHYFIKLKQILFSQDLDYELISSL